jgi:hypothetical protein
MSTYADLISEARDFTQDNLAPFRNEDVFYIQHLNRGLQEIGRMRPDAFYELFDANNLNVPVVVVSDDPEALEAPQVATTEEFQIDMMFYAPMLAYLIGISEVQDDEFTDEGRAAMLLQQFRNTILGL